MLSYARRRAPDDGFVHLETGGGLRLPDAADRRLFELGDDAAGDDLFVADDLASTQDRRAGNIRRIQPLEPFGRAVLHDILRHLMDARGRIHRTRGGCREAGVLGKFGIAGRPAEALPFGIRDSARGDVAVAGLEHKIRPVIRISRRRFGADDRVLHHALWPEVRNHDVEHRDLDVVAPSGLLAGIEGGRYRLCGINRRGLVADDSADHLGPVGDRLRLDVGKSGQRLDDGIVDALLDVRSGVANAADRHIDQAGVTFSQFLGSETKPLHRARTKILHQHVGLCDESGHHLAAGLALDVDRQRSFAAIRRDEHGGEFSGLVDRGAAAAGAVARYRLDLDDVGALIRQEHGREWTGYDGSQIDYTDALEWT